MSIAKCTACEGGTELGAAGGKVGAAVLCFLNGSMAASFGLELVLYLLSERGEGELNKPKSHSES